MKLYITAQGNTAQAFHLTTSVSWNGDKRRAARALSFGLLCNQADPNLPAVPCPVGAQVALDADGGERLFTGMAVSRQATAGRGYVSVVCYDRGMYLSGNDGTYKFREETPEDAARRICRDYGIPTGALAATGVRVSRKFQGQSLWAVLTAMYTKAAEQTGRRYLARFDGQGRLEVVERTEGAGRLVIQPGSNLLSASTTQSVSDMRNSVAIYDKNGMLLQTVQDGGAVALYGLMQRHLIQRDGEDATGEANSVLEDRGLSQTVTVECLGDPSLVTGDTVTVREPETGLSGVFWIDADTHTWQEGAYSTRLTLNCRNVMYQSSAGSDL